MLVTHVTPILYNHQGHWKSPGYFLVCMQTHGMIFQHSQMMLHGAGIYDKYYQCLFLELFHWVGIDYKWWLCKVQRKTNYIHNTYFYTF